MAQHAHTAKLLTTKKETELASAAPPTRSQPVFSRRSGAQPQNRRIPRPSHEMVPGKLIGVHEPGEDDVRERPAGRRRPQLASRTARAKIKQRCCYRSKSQGMGHEPHRDCEEHKYVSQHDHLVKEPTRIVARADAAGQAKLEKFSLTKLFFSGSRLWRAGRPARPPNCWTNETPVPPLTSFRTVAPDSKAFVDYLQIAGQEDLRPEGGTAARPG